MNDNDINDAYKMFDSSTSYYTQYKDYFEDENGYPNKRAYKKFTNLISKGEETYYLACLSINLKTANAINFAYGNYVLRRVINSIRNGLNNCYVFRVTGDKFNVLIHSDSLEDFKKYINAPKDNCIVYCGLIEEPYNYDRNYELVQKGINLMFQDKAKKNLENKIQSNVIYGNKRNVPVELQETETRKYRSTMWYSMIELTVTEPYFSQATLYIYPTKFNNALESVPIIVVIDEIIKYRIEYGKTVVFGLGGIRFSINARFDRDGHFNVFFFREDGSQVKNYEYDINTVEGKHIPVNFGKRVGKDEIYPIKQTPEGLYDYVLLKDVDLDHEDDESYKPQIVTNGIVEKNGVKYGVHLDDTFVELIPM